MRVINYAEITPKTRLSDPILKTGTTTGIGLYNDDTF